MNRTELPCSADRPFGLILRRSAKPPSGIKPNKNAIGYYRALDEFGRSLLSFEIRHYANGLCSIYSHSRDCFGQALDKLGPHPNLLGYSAPDLAGLPIGEAFVLPEGVPEPRMLRQVKRAWLDAERPLRVPFRPKKHRNDPDARPCRLAVSFRAPTMTFHVAEIGPLGTAGREWVHHVHDEFDLMPCGLRARDLLRAMGRSTFGVFQVEPVPAERYVESPLPEFVPIHAEQIVPSPVDAIVAAGEDVAAMPEIERPDAFEDEAVEAAVIPDPIEGQPADPLRSTMSATLARTKPAARRRVEILRGLKRVRAGVRLPRPTSKPAPVKFLSGLRTGVASLADLGMVRPLEVLPPASIDGPHPPFASAPSAEGERTGTRPDPAPDAFARQRPPPV